MLVYDKQLYDDLYQASLPDGRTIHYGREFLNLQDPPHWARQQKVLEELQVSGNILIVGCGFSPLLATFRDSVVWGTDPSPYIQANKRAETEYAERIRPYRIPHKGLKNHHWDAVITDDVVPGIPADPIVPVGGSRSNPELEEFLDACTELADDQLVHFVTPKSGSKGDPRLTWLSLEQWASFAPEHIWVNNLTMEVWDA